MDFTSTNVDSNVRDPYERGQRTPRDFPLELTPEEMKVLKECAKEGIFQGGIPMGLLFGVGGLMGSRAGFLSPSWGSKLAVTGLGLFGYFFGRFLHSKKCLQKVLEVPDGNLRKLYAQEGGGFGFNIPKEVQPDSNFYASVDPPKRQDTIWDNTPVPSVDLDVAAMSQFDTIPSEYYKPNDENITEPLPPQNFTSYDDLRKQNREAYTNRFQHAPPQSSQQRYPSPQDRPVRRPEPQDTQPTDFGKQKTKYGDTWE